uniref:Reverse transcriptase/retrotransposon-derived protein RNase H-like domain-containing protein n=1 Tax=Strigamia maritima TaxID=126957 RepID=T1IKN7_STRMM
MHICHSRNPPFWKNHILGWRTSRPWPHFRRRPLQNVKLSTRSTKFFGFANSFRRYIKNYAAIARPLTALLKTVRQPSNKLDNSAEVRHSKSPKPVVLNAEQQAAFQELKVLITSPPILAYFKQRAPTFVETDASYERFGACLTQDHDGNKRVIEYARRMLKDTETRYHINELECAAVHWALLEKFHFYLLGLPL